MFDKDWLFSLAKSLQGLPIMGALEGTPAARMGIRYGDVLLSVNGHKTHTFGDYVHAKSLREDGMEVVVFRDGREQTWDLVFEGRPAGAVQILAELALKNYRPDSVPAGAKLD